MKRVYSAENGLMMDYLSGLLEDRGIHCMLRNQLLSGASGELPPIETWPTLWVLDDRDAKLAQALIDEVLQEPENDQVEWHCPHCGEDIEAQFSQCWQCGTARPED